jgi:DNA-binding transcriptional MerR regulator
VETEPTRDLTIDELAAASGTTTRRIRSLQTLGLLPPPELRGRTGLYGPRHQERLSVILRLQGRGFSLESLRELFLALQSGQSLAAVLGLPEHAARATAPPPAESPQGSGDTAELYGFAQLQPAAAARNGRRARRPLLSIVPTTVWEDENRAS